MMKQRLKVAFLLLALASLAAYNSDVKPKLIGDLKNAEKAERIIPVRTLVTEPASNIITNSYAGVVEESLSMDLSFKYGGTLERLMVKEGSRVKKGTPIAVVSSATAINAQRTAKATLDQAQDAYERLKLVYDSGSLPEVKWQEMLANLEKAKATADLADDMVKECTLIAPVDGLVTEINAEVGANVSPLFPIMKLISTDAVFVRISVPEKEISKINLGDEASIQLPALNDSVFPAKVLEKGVVANLLSHAYSVKLGLDNSQGVLLPGMIGRVLLASDTQENIVIPSNVVLMDLNGKFVWTVKEGRAHKRNITVGGYSDNGVVVASGLQSGDSVIVEGYPKVSENMKVLSYE